MSKVNDNLVIENAHIIFRNFAGKEAQYNRAGNRNFCVLIEDPAIAEKLLEDGWNVKTRNPREEGDEPIHYIQVIVNFDTVPPTVWMVTKHNKRRLGPETIENLDYADIRSCDLIIRPYNWKVNGKSGVKGYLKTAYVTIEEDEFAEKYAEEEIPEE